MNYLNKLYVRFLVTTKDEKGATMVEYALMLALIAVVAMVTAATVGENAKGMLGTIAEVGS